MIHANPLTRLLWIWIIATVWFVTGCSSTKALERAFDTGTIPEGVDMVECIYIEASAGGSVTNFTVKGEGCHCKTIGDPPAEVIKVALDKCSVGESDDDQT